MNHRSAWLQAAGSLFLLAAGLLLATATVSGCGKGGEKPQKTGNAGRGSKSPAPETVRRQDNGDNLAARPHRGVWMNNGQKYYNKHPYDVWYPNAYQVAADSRPVGSAGNGRAVAVAQAKKSAAQPVKTKAAPQASGGWKSLVSGAELEAEMKRIAIFCNEKLLMVSRYNSSFKEIANNAAALSAVAQIAAVHPDPISWKEDALYLRDLGLKLSETATERGTKKFKEAKEQFEKIDGILKKNKPAGLGEPKKGATFFDVAGRGSLMRRMEAAHKWLKSEIKTEEQFKSNLQTIAHEATMLGLMAQVIGDKSYDSAEDPRYKRYVATTIGEARKIVAATKAGNFAVYQPALDKIYNQCNECHNSGFR
jgi:hypothetical protein